MAEWYEGISNALTKGIMKSPTEPNWMGVGLTAVLAGGAAFFTSGFGVIPMVLSTLALGAGGLALGGLISGGFGADVDDASQFSDVNASQNAGARTPARATARQLETIEVVDQETGEIVKKEIPDTAALTQVLNETENYKSDITQGKTQGFYSIVLKNQDERDGAKENATAYAENTATLIEAAEITEEHVGSNTAKYKQYKEDLLSINYDGLSMVTVIQNYARRTGTPIESREELNNMRLSELFNTAEAALTSKMGAIRHAGYNPVGVDGGVFFLPDDATKNAEDTMDYVLQYFDKEDLDNVRYGIDHGISGDGTRRSLRYNATASDVKDSTQARIESIMLLEKLAQLREKIFDQKTEVAKTAHKDLTLNISKITIEKALASAAVLKVERKQLETAAEEPTTEPEKEEKAAEDKNKDGEKDDVTSLDTSAEQQMNKALESFNRGEAGDIKHNILDDLPTQVASTQVDGKGLPLDGGDFLKPDSNKGIQA